jgi:hypothetical protein
MKTKIASAAGYTPGPGTPGVSPTLQDTPANGEGVPLPPFAPSQPTVPVDAFCKTSGGQFQQGVQYEGTFTGVTTSSWVKVHVPSYLLNPDVNDTMSVPVDGYLPDVSVDGNTGALPAC